MAQAVPNAACERKRVKVYELRHNDWFDRGTGFCYASDVNDNTDGEPRMVVEAEDANDRRLLETLILKQSGFAKQQDTLIIWTEPATGVDMALSFQEAEGCSSIWKFIKSFDLALGDGAQGNVIDDIQADIYNQNMVRLPEPKLANLKEIDDEMRNQSNTQVGRDALAKYVIHEEYIQKLVPLVGDAEDLESLSDLHRLCNIMKTLILLNDNDIIEFAMSDAVIEGVVGALEYDPDFPSHKTNHRQWLSDKSRYKEVVRIGDDVIRQKIHHTYRLQYLKDVVLARILDDPTFSILNSLIFYYQVDILNYIQGNTAFLKELFAIFSPQETDQKRKKDAVLFIQQCCAIAKNLQAQARNTLYNNLLSHGLLSVINFALRHGDVAVRVGATDVLVSVIDHDPQMIRQTIFRQISEKQTPLTDSLIDLLLVEIDLGVKAQVADAIKVLLDAGTAPLMVQQDQYSRQLEMAKLRSQPDPQQDMFLANFYENSARRLFSPLAQLADREDMSLNFQQVALFEHLIEILWFFIKQHQHRSKYFIVSEKLCLRISKLLLCPEKHLKLSAVRFFRQLMQLNDEFYNNQMIDDRLFEPIINLLVETMPRDNLLNSACLEFFEFVGNNNRAVTAHIIDTYRDRLYNITYVPTFRNIIQRYDHAQAYNANMEGSFMDTEEDTPGRSMPGRNGRWQGLREMDAAEEDYFNTSDDEEEMLDTPSKAIGVNGASPVKPLVDYPSDDDTEAHDAKTADSTFSHTDGAKDDAKDEDKERATEVPTDAEVSSKENEAPTTPTTPKTGLTVATPPERLSEKRRREEDDDDELLKLSQNKRRSSSASANSSTPVGKTITITTKRIVK